MHCLGSLFSIDHYSLSVPQFDVVLSKMDNIVSIPSLEKYISTIRTGYPILVNSYVI